MGVKVLVGYTGFVGSNLYHYGTFDHGFNTANIGEAYGMKPDLLVYAGVRAEKYLANEYPEKDWDSILSAQENIERIGPKRLVLISTVDVLGMTPDADEDAEVVTDGLHPYGYHRYLLEKWAREYDEKALIVRLPALFGLHIKKNFIYDYIKRIPFRIKKEKMEELAGVCPDIVAYYTAADDRYFECRTLTPEEQRELKKLLAKADFSALNFTDSRSSYQFYPLDRLWEDIVTVMDSGLTLWHPATEPVTAGDLFHELEGKTFCNEILDRPVSYHFITKSAALFGKNGDYICDRTEIIRKIKQFVKTYAENDRPT